MTITGTYNLEVDRKWAQSQTRIIMLECDTSGAPVTINLPEISDIYNVNGQFVQIYVVDKSNNSLANNITVNANIADRIDNGNTSALVINTDGASVLFTIAKDNLWSALESVLPGNLSRGLFSQIEDGPNVSNTTDEESLLGAGIGSLITPANEYQIGSTFHLSMAGKISAVNTHDLHFHIYQNGGIIADIPAITMPAVTDKRWELEIDFTIRSLGGLGAASVQTTGEFIFNKNASNAFDGLVFSVFNNANLDTTVDNTLDVKTHWSVADPGDSIQNTLCYFSQIY